MAKKITEIAKSLGMPAKDVLAKATEIGIVAKTTTSSLDEISADLLIDTLTGTRAVEAEESSANLRVSITLSGAWASSFIRQLRSKKVFVDVALAADANATSERVRLAPVDVSHTEKSAWTRKDPIKLDPKTRALLIKTYRATVERDGDWTTLAQFGDVLKRLNPDFRPAAIGASSMSDLVERTSELFEVKTDNSFQVPVISIRPKAAPIPSQGEAGHLMTGELSNLHGTYGFIKPSNGGESLFFHASDLQGLKIESLKEGSIVSYVPGTNERGPCAKNVKLKESNRG